MRNGTKTIELHDRSGGSSNGRLTKRQRPQEKSAFLGIARRHHNRREFRRSVRVLIHQLNVI